MLDFLLIGFVFVVFFLFCIAGVLHGPEGETPANSLASVGERIVTFESDGVRLTTRFIPYSEIATASHAQSVNANAIGLRPNVQNLIVLHLHSGEDVHVLTVRVRVEPQDLDPPDSTGVSAPPDKETSHRLELLRSRLVTAGPDGAVTSALLTRNGRDAGAWFESLSNRS